MGEKMFNKHTLYTVILVVLLAADCFLLFKDPFNLRFKNEIRNISSQELRSSSSTIYGICGNLNFTDRQDCYEAQLSIATKTYGLANAIAILSAIQNNDSFAQGCHLISHYMSHEAYLREPGNFFSMIDSVNVGLCGGGFLHGLIQGYSGDHPEITIDGDFAKQVCERSKDGYRIATCMHFMGHIFILKTEGKVQPALDLCLGVQENWRYNCYDGVFMEDHQKLMLSDHDIMPLPTLDTAYFNSMESTCQKYTGEISRACWTEMAEMYAHGHGYNPATIFKDCSKASDEINAQACYFKGVVAMAVYPGFDSPHVLTYLCSFYKGDMNKYAKCTHTLLSSLVYNSPKFTSRGVTYCENMTTDTLKNTCFSDLDSTLKTVIPSSDTRKEYCNLIPDTYRASCKK